MFQVAQKLPFFKAASNPFISKLRVDKRKIPSYGSIKERIRKRHIEELDQSYSSMKGSQSIRVYSQIGWVEPDTEEWNFKQKARVSWLKEGDRNSKDRHATLKERRARKTLRRRKHESGTIQRVEAYIKRKHESGTIQCVEAYIKRKAELPTFINIVGTASWVRASIIEAGVV